MSVRQNLRFVHKHLDYQPRTGDWLDFLSMKNNLKPAMSKPVTPLLTTDLVIEIGNAVVLIERQNEPLGFALPGGFVDVGETVEAAAIREAKEETGLSVELHRLLGVYSDPARDPRGHTVSVVYVASAHGQKPKAGDDARAVHLFPQGDWPQLAFDHQKILDDYMRGKGAKL